MSWVGIWASGCTGLTTLILGVLLGRFTGKGKVRVASLPGRLDRCGREGCRHQRIQHYIDADEWQHCAANQVWPHIDPKTGAKVPYSHCGCVGFIEASTVDAP